VSGDSDIKVYFSFKNSKNYPLFNKWRFHRENDNCVLQTKACGEFSDDMHFYYFCVEGCPWVPLLLGQMLTGDAELGKQEYENHYRTERNKVGMFLLPHHGSSNNWRNWFINSHPNCAVWVCSSGINYKHPHQKVIDDLAVNENMLFICNEVQMMSIEIVLH
jgi:hypothetical protein